MPYISGRIILSRGITAARLTVEKNQHVFAISRSMSYIVGGTSDRKPTGMEERRTSTLRTNPPSISPRPIKYAGIKVTAGTINDFINIITIPGIRYFLIGPNCIASPIELIRINELNGMRT